MRYGTINRLHTVKLHRHKEMETHVAEAIKKNDFLSDLHKLDTGKMEVKVRGSPNSSTLGEKCIA